jgi:hypothetical protein
MKNAVVPATYTTILLRREIHHHHHRRLPSSAIRGVETLRWGCSHHHFVRLNDRPSVFVMRRNHFVMRHQCLVIRLNRHFVHQCLGFALFVLLLFQGSLVLLQLNLLLLQMNLLLLHLLIDWRLLVLLAFLPPSDFRLLAAAAKAFGVAAARR